MVKLSFMQCFSELFSSCDWKLDEEENKPYYFRRAPPAVQWLPAGERARCPGNRLDPLYSGYRCRSGDVHWACGGWWSEINLNFKIVTVITMKSARTDSWCMMNWNLYKFKIATVITMKSVMSEGWWMIVWNRFELEIVTVMTMNFVTIVWKMF